MAKWMYVFAILALLMISSAESQDLTIMKSNPKVFDETEKAADDNWRVHQTTRNKDHRVFDETRKAADSNDDAVVDETIDPKSADE